jgi:hypothetical protein
MSLCLRNYFLFCHNEHAQSTISGLKLMFWGGSMPFRSRTWHVAVTGIEVHLMHEFMPLELFLVFLQQTCRTHYFSSKTQVLHGSAPFCCRTQPAAKISIGVHLKHEFVPRKPILVWPQRTCSIHNFGSKPHVYNSAWYLNALLHSFWW